MFRMMGLSTTLMAKPPCSGVNDDQRKNETIQKGVILRALSQSSLRLAYA
jgi:hypothetical protein